jgi:hypothetical protein
MLPMRILRLCCNAKFPSTRGEFSPPNITQNCRNPKKFAQNPRKSPQARKNLLYLTYDTFLLRFFEVSQAWLCRDICIYSVPPPAKTVPDFLRNAEKRPNSLKNAKNIFSGLVKTLFTDRNAAAGTPATPNRVRDTLAGTPATANQACGKDAGTPAAAKRACRGLAGTPANAKRACGRVAGNPATANQLCGKVAGTPAAFFTAAINTTKQEHRHEN